MADLKQELASAGVQLVGAGQSLELIVQALDRAKAQPELAARWASAENEIRAIVEDRAAKLQAAEAAVRAAVEADVPDNQQAAATAFIRALTRLADAAAQVVEAEAKATQPGGEG